MVVFRHPSTKAWIIIYIVFPLIPFMLGGMIRMIISSGGLFWTAFSASELAICFALLSLFINQNLLRTERVLDNKDKKEDVEMAALVFLLSAVFFIVLFAVIITCDVTVYLHEVEMLKRPLQYFQLIVFGLAPFMLSWSISIQRSFRLRANL